MRGGNKSLCLNQLKAKVRLTHFQAIFQLWRNQLVGFYQQNVWKTPVESDILSKDVDR